MAVLFLINPLASLLGSIRFCAASERLLVTLKLRSFGSGYNLSSSPRIAVRGVLRWNDVVGCVVARDLCHFMGLLLAGMLALREDAASAQTFPARPLRMVVAYPSGTTTDLLARIIVPRMSAYIGKPIVVDNKGGASGSEGAQLVANATPDGYTVMLGTSGIMAGNEALMSKLGYSPDKDFAAVGGVAHNPMLLAVGAVTGVRSVAELVEFVKNNSAKANFGSTDVGGTPALAAASFRHAAGLKASHVPYNSAAQWVQSGFDVWATTPEALSALGARERARYKDLVKRCGGIEN